MNDHNLTADPTVKRTGARARWDATNGRELADARMLAASAELQPEVELPRGGGIGRVVRPTPDREPDPPAPKQQPDALLLPDEHTAIHTSSRPLARIAARATELQAELHDAIADRAKRAALLDECEQLERERTGAPRGAARVACLTAVEAAARRAAEQYVTASAMVADAACAYEAAAKLVDRLTGLNRWDGLGVWIRDNKLLAPEARHRPQSLRVVPGGWTGDLLWSADNQQHLNAVEAGITRLRAELQHGLNGSGWPF